MVVTGWSLRYGWVGNHKLILFCNIKMSGLSTGTIRPDGPLPLPQSFSDPDAYVTSLLHLVTTSETLQSLCGGVHILEFFTRTPDLYSGILPLDWREWAEKLDHVDFLDLLMREDIEQFTAHPGAAEQRWRDYTAPPASLVAYIKQIRDHSLARDFIPPAQSTNGKRTLSRQVARGMNVKKLHEVSMFTEYIDQLTSSIAAQGDVGITHLVDFGSGQNYLGRALASEPHNKHIVAVESRHHNVEGARKMDIHAKLAPRPKTIVNKKAWRVQKSGAKAATSNGTAECDDCIVNATLEQGFDEQQPQTEVPSSPQDIKDTLPPGYTPGGSGTIQYIEHRILDGNLGSVIDQVRVPDHRTKEDNENCLEKGTACSTDISPSPSFMVISLHSCGNLLHHGLRSIVLNSSVQAIAMVGCCYNLLTERLGPPTYKLPALRTNHPRLEETANAFDPHGFPMSERLAQYQHAGSDEIGIRLNITARMMAVQAPQNWGREDSELFFLRHFFRALLQRIFLDKGVIRLGSSAASAAGQDGRSSYMGVEGDDSEIEPIILGSLRKVCYTNFVLYVRGAVEKLTMGPEAKPHLSRVILEKMGDMTEEEILDYEKRFWPQKRQISIMWSLMAFSAGVIESAIVVDRWLWLKEQKEVKECWVEPVFDFGMSPRNLVIVAIKK